MNFVFWATIEAFYVTPQQRENFSFPLFKPLVGSVGIIHNMMSLFPSSSFSQRHTFPTGSVKTPMEFLRKSLVGPFPAGLQAKVLQSKNSCRSVAEVQYPENSCWSLGEILQSKNFTRPPFFAADPPCYDFLISRSKMVSPSSSPDYICTYIHVVSHFLHLFHSFIQFVLPGFLLSRVEWSISNEPASNGGGLSRCPSSSSFWLRNRERRVSWIQASNRFI